MEIPRPRFNRNRWRAQSQACAHLRARPYGRPTSLRRSKIVCRRRKGLTGLDVFEPRASVRDEADPGENPAPEVLHNSEGRFYFKVADRWSQSATRDIAGAVIGQQLRSIRRLGLVQHAG